MNNPMVSIIIPVKNAGNRLGRCVESVLAQSYEDYECLIVDDHSSDNSVQNTVKKYGDKRIRSFINSRNGVSAARNTAIENANGKYLVFCDADDYMPNDSIAKRVSAMEKDSILGGCFGSCIFDEANNLFSKMQTRESKFSDLDNESKNFLLETSFFEVGIKTGLEYVWDKIFMTQEVRRNNILFDEKYDRYEDRLYVLDYINAIRGNMRFYDENVYYYVRPKKNTVSTVYYKNELGIILSLYHRYLAALAFAGIYCGDCYSGCAHFLINKVIRTLYMAEKGLDDDGFYDLCKDICTSGDINSAAAIYQSKNKNENMSVVNIIKQSDSGLLFDFFKRQE